EMRVFYINVGGGEPMTRPDFFELVDYAIAHRIGVKFSTNGTFVDRAAARWIATTDYLDVQISVDGAREDVNDPIRGPGSFARARGAMDLLAGEGFPFKVNHVVTRQSFDGLDALHEMVTGMGGQLRVTRLRPSGRGREVWNALKLTAEQNRSLYSWLRAHPHAL